VTGRVDVRIPTPDGELAAWLFEPAEDAERPAPCVVLAHGFTGVRDMRLENPARRFAEAGLAALVFDYRHFGDSDGEPRQLLDLRRQYEDWDAAIAFARGLEHVDARRIVLWGTSFSGGHVIDAAARHRDIAAVIAQAPFMDGLAQSLRIAPPIAARLILDGLRDELRGRRKRPPRLVPVSAPPGGYAVLSDPHVWESVPVLVPEGSTWRNEVAARIALRLGRHRPVRRAKRVACPALIQVVEDETVVVNRPAERVARDAPQGELRSYPGLNHFDVYVGEGFERLNADQVDFLRRHVLPVTKAEPTPVS
jgi:fermentation-respiration switch protein FrsA (DUF1100 family)